jgi:hypothetical protein
MAIRTVQIDCGTICRKDRAYLKIGTSGSNGVSISYGINERDVFFVDKEDLVNALNLMGIIDVNKERT